VAKFIPDVPEIPRVPAIIYRVAPDSAFSYPTGYRICRIFEKYPARISGRIPDISVDKAQPFFAGWILELHNKWGLVTIF
jgi:hypothetical protein